MRDFSTPWRAASLRGRAVRGASVAPIAPDSRPPRTRAMRRRCSRSGKSRKRRECRTARPTPARDAAAARPRHAGDFALAQRCRTHCEKSAARGIPFLLNCAIVAADGVDLPLTGGSASECSALCSASIHRKENYGHRQESCQEACREEARREKACRKETRRKETRREKGNGEKTGCEKSGSEETRREAQTQRRVHEGDDAVGESRRRHRRDRRCRAPK